MQDRRMWPLIGCHNTQQTLCFLGVQANDDNYARAHSLVEKLKKDYNALCREAKQKQTKLSNMRVELQQLSSLVSATSPSAEMCCVSYVLHFCAQSRCHGSSRQAHLLHMRTI